MNVLVTGGAGFIGRWVVKKLLDGKHRGGVIDDFSNGSEENIAEFLQNDDFRGLVVAGVEDSKAVNELFYKNKFDVCIHAAAQINVQESIDFPQKSFDSNILGTFNVLEAARKTNCKVVVIGTCMVYDLSSGTPISEKHEFKALSPYAASKIAAEAMAEAYFHSFGLPVVILRPFNTFGPFQKSNMEGGVVSIFVQRKLNGETIEIFGSGNQTRDLLFVEDCAEFIVEAAFSEKAVGQVLNAGTGKDISINDLAFLIVKDKSRVRHVKHHHPQAEINKLVCDYSKAKKVLGWKPKTKLEEGLAKTEQWLKQQKVKK